MRFASIQELTASRGSASLIGRALAAQPPARWARQKTEGHAAPKSARQRGLTWLLSLEARSGVLFTTEDLTYLLAQHGYLVTATSQTIS